MIQERYTYDSPKSWEELVSLAPKIRSSDPKCNRSADDYLFYKLYNELVPRNIRLEIINRMMEGNDYKILRNNFPYQKLLQFLPGVEHYCLWSCIGELSPEIIEQEISKKFPDQKYMWLENSPETKSIPELWHCHIFIKEK